MQALCAFVVKTEYRFGNQLANRVNSIKITIVEVKMAFSEFELKRYGKVIEDFLVVHRPPVELRAQVDISYRIDGQSIEIFELRPVWNDPTKITECSIAKATYVKSKNEWKIYWMKSDFKWHSYEPVPLVKELSSFTEIVAADEYSCFWG